MSDSAYRARCLTRCSSSKEPTCLSVLHPCLAAALAFQGLRTSTSVAESGAKKSARCHTRIVLCRRPSPVTSTLHPPECMAIDERELGLVAVPFWRGP